MKSAAYAFLLAVFATIGIAFWGWQAYQAPGPLTEPRTVLLPRGSGVAGIAETLAQEGVISNPFLFEAAAFATRQAHALKAGEYAFPAAISVQEVLELIAAGRVVVHKITVPEGWAVRDVLDALVREPALTGDLPPNIAEGSLWPETYHFTLGDTREGIVRRMQKSAAEALAAAWEKRAENLPLETPAQALVLASIVEKETGVNDERARVAAVFINRLRQGIRLQSDPTVAYGIEQAQSAPLARALTTADLEAPTAYNTYTIPALPPAPICNPGKSALEAALHPAQTNELYFVATGHGGHAFAATLAEHNKNVAAYRQLMQQSAAPAAAPQ